MKGLWGRVFGKNQQDHAQYDHDYLPPQPLQPVAVVGDIHGCSDLLANLLDQLENRSCEVIVTVGDYVDRGEDSAAVLSMLMAKSTATPERFVCLMGNHEKMMLDFLDRPEERGRRWLRNGGLQTLASFGIGGVTETAAEDLLRQTSETLRNALPEGMEDWIRGLPDRWSSGSLWVVHAAADPALPVNAQDKRTLLWGHGAFLTTPRRDGLWVAHGHTIVDMPEMRRSRISVDTGAYHSGRLTAAIIGPSGEVDFVQAFNGR